MRSIARLFLFAALALSAAALSACAPTMRETQGPALWRLADQDSEIWLFGTVHVLPPTLKWRTARIDNAFSAADTIYFETATDAQAQPQIAALAERYGYNPKGVTLSAMMSGEDRARFARVCARLKLNCALMEPLRPWYAANAISVVMVLQQGQSLESGVERVLDREAVAQKKQRAYFETAEQQVRFFADLAPEVEMQFLTATLRQAEEEADMVDELDAAWVRGDTKALNDDLNSLLAETGPDIYAALITNRNARWAAEIDALMRGEGKIFIAVGAAHLVGDDGVPALLRAKGYKVEGP